MYSFGVFSGDVRMRYLYDSLKRDGYVADMFLGGDADSFVKPNNVIILPIGGDYSGIIGLCGGKTVFGGFVGDTPTAPGVRVINYLENEYFKIRNALPTAEGAVEIAMAQTDFTVSGCRSAVTGFGNIGKSLTDILLCIGADVTVVARNPKDRAQAENYGADACGFDELENIKPDILFNTVPAPVVTERVLKKLPRDTLVIDLASAPGGVDFECAARLNINAVHALGIPGKFAPRTAGEILKKTVISILDGK